MNIIFTTILLISLVVLTIFNPSSVLLALSSCSNSAISLCVKLLVTYSVWLGFTEILLSSGLNDKMANAFYKPIKKIFGTNNKNTISNLSLNLTANILGISALSTPTAITCMQNLDSENNNYGKDLLFVISATSLQVLPLSVMQLLIEYGSTTPHIIFFPTLLTTFLSTTIGIILLRVLK